MTKTDKKSDHVSTARPPLVSGFLERLGLDARAQRFLLLLFFALLLAFIIVPKGGLTPTDYVAGDIAARDIKAPRDLLIPDEALTEKKRLEAEKGVPVYYDYDGNTTQSITERLGQFFGFLRSERDPEPSIEQLRTGLENDFGVKAGPKEIKLLLQLADEPTAETVLRQLLVRAYQRKVVGNLKLFESDRARGIIFISLDDQREIPDDGKEAVLGVGELQDLVRRELNATPFSKEQRLIIFGLLGDKLRPNVSYNRTVTEAHLQAAREAVQPVLIQVKKGEMIVREGDRVTEDQVRKLLAMQQDTLHGTFWRHAAGLLLTCFLTIFIGHRFARRDIRKYRVNNRDIVFLTMTFVSLVLLLKIGIFMASAMGSAFPYVESSAYYYLLPFAVGAMLVRIVLNSEVALVFSVLFSAVVGFLFGNIYTMFIYALLSCLAGAHWVRHVMVRSSLYRAGLRVAIFNFLVIFALHLMTGKPFDFQLIYKLSFGFFGGLLAAMMVTGIVPLVESLFRYTTNLKLLELANMNNPVLRDLMVQAPGTYHHSIIVGNLVEAAAEAIGANPLMARVAAYYHDIGKVRKPLYFIENLGAEENRHDKLSPSMSALILTAHVKDGVEMARESRLGEAMIDIIRQHHGTSLMKFFYDKAKNKEKAGVEQIDERDYRYPGPKPQTREAALIMLADAVEAASRTLTDPTPARIQGMVQKIINNIFIDGQLDECELTLKDMHNIAKSFNRVLSGIFHHRVDYPEPVSKERAVEKPPKKTSEDSDRKPAKESKDPEAQPKKGSAEDLKRLGMS